MVCYAIRGPSRVSGRAARARGVLLLLLAALCASNLAAVVSAAAAEPCADPADAVVLENKSGVKLVLLPTGATMHRLYVPACAREGGPSAAPVDVLLGYDDAAAYGLDPHPSFGATVGRVANRISNSKFTLNGRDYTLLANEGKNSVHGGTARLSKANWAAAARAADGRSAAFTATQADGDGGFPGRLDAKVEYRLPETGAAVDITITATVDKPSPVNIINHAYFNLKGHAAGDILDHVAHVPSAYFTPSARDLIPTGQILSVQGTPYDFRAPAPLAARAARANGGNFTGYDVNYVLPRAPASAAAAAAAAGAPQEPVWWTPGENPQARPGAAAAAAAAGAPLNFAVAVTAPKSGRTLKLYTDAPGFNLYTGNFLGGADSGAAGYQNKGGLRYKQYDGFCLEAQAFPNAVNTPTFPSPVLRPGEVFVIRMRYEFSCDGAPAPNGGKKGAAKAAAKPRGF